MTDLETLAEDIYAVAMKILAVTVDGDQDQLPVKLRSKLYKLADHLSSVSSDLDEYLVEVNEPDPINDPNDKASRHHY